MTINKRMIFYVRSEEIFKKLKSEQRRSDIFNMLIEEYYSQDLEYLKQKKQELAEKQEIIDLKIKNKEKQNEIIKKQIEQEKQKINEIKARKEFTSKIMDLWRQDKISEKEYYSMFTDGKLNIKKAKSIFDKLNTQPHISL